MAHWHGFMAFMAQSPIVGLDPQPSWAPQETTPTPTTAQAWAEEIYQAHADLADALIEAEEDSADVEDTDTVFPVCVHDDGTLVVFDGTNPAPWRTYTAADVFGAFGMRAPE